MPLAPGASAGINDGAREFREREQREEAERTRKEEESRNKRMKREEWMLTLPEEVSLLSCQSRFLPLGDSALRPRNIALSSHRSLDCCEPPTDEL